MYSFNELQGIFEQELRSMKWPREPRLLYEPIAYSLEEGGKRIRPVALLMACSAFRGGIDAAKPAAMAIEVFHNFTLLHDDIMDRSDMRRGKPAVHTRWNDNVAILSGDAMMIWAYRLLSQCDEAVLPQLLAVFTDVAVGVCEGQQYDMDFESRDDVTVEEYLRMIELKTAVLLAGALKIGALCGGAEPVQAELLYRFGIDLGMAFQLQDDLLDTYGDPAVFGKPVGGDILVGKKTYLLTTALKAADLPTRAHDRIARADVGSRTVFVQPDGQSFPAWQRVGLADQAVGHVGRLEQLPASLGEHGQTVAHVLLRQGFCG